MARGGRSWLATAAVGGSVGVMFDLPGLMTGALAVPITQELAFGTAGLGAAIAAVRGAASVTSITVGRLADHMGATNSLRLATTAAALSSAGIALTATNWALLTGWLVLSGIAISLGHPAANRLLSINVPRARQGIAFGIKQAAPPTASLLAGLSVPAIGVTLGWRWAFGFAAIVAASMLIVIGRRPVRSRRVPAGPRMRVKLGNPRPLIVLGLAFGFGTAAGVVTPAFYVDAAVRAGSSVQFAGTLLAVASAATIAMRVMLGFVADRLGTGHLRLCAGLLATGAVGFVLLSTGDPSLMAIGVIVAMATTWGYNGVFWFAVMDVYREAPGTVTGMVSPGGHIGGSLGPLAFGAFAAAAGYPAAWVAATVAGLLAACFMLGASRLVGRPPDGAPA